MGSLELSVEVFPPRQGEAESFKAYLRKLKPCKLRFISITCGAGGTSNTNNIPYSSYAQQELKLTTVSHLTCAGVTKDKIISTLGTLKSKQIKSIMALRGDAFAVNDKEKDFNYATDLCQVIKQHYPSADIYVAGYPEGHQHSLDNEQNFQHQLNKAKTYAMGVVTQLFFDNSKFERYVNKMRRAGFKGTIHAGILPITTIEKLNKIQKLSNASLPKKLKNELAKYAADQQSISRLGVEYALKQIEELKQINPYIHLYTLNNAALTQTILDKC